MEPLLSVIIPCFNSGKFLPDAINSVQDSLESGICEVIITDDGSTDELTLNLLTDLSSKGFKVLHQANKGPAAARNTAIRASKCPYLLFLDSDNKVRKGYIEKGIDVLKSNAEVGVVYAKAGFFGDSTEPRFEATAYDLKKLLTKNYIDMCAVVRKQVWEEVGGFDEERVLIGNEDWELWLRISATRWKFHFINEVLFDYRVSDNSLTVQINKDKPVKMLNYIYRKNVDLLLKNYVDLYWSDYKYQVAKNSPFKSFIKFSLFKYFKKEI